MSKVLTSNVTRLLDSDLPKEVADFCREHDILNELKSTIKLASSSFKEITALDLEVVPNPELDEQWVRITISVRESVDEILDSHRAFLTSFVKQIPFPQNEFIRISYDIEE